MFSKLNKTTFLPKGYHRVSILNTLNVAPQRPDLRPSKSQCSSTRRRPNQNYASNSPLIARYYPLKSRERQQTPQMSSALITRAGYCEGQRVPSYAASPIWCANLKFCVQSSVLVVYRVSLEYRKSRFPALLEVVKFYGGNCSGPRVGTCGRDFNPFGARTTILYSSQFSSPL